MTGYDVAVVGGGPAGSALACRLSGAGRSVVVLESSHYDTPRIGESLAPSVGPLLHDLGVWDDFCALEPLPSWGTRSQWGRDQIESHSHLGQVSQQGWHVDRRAMDQMLAVAAVDHGADVRRGRHVRAADHQASGWEVTTDAGDSVSAQVLVDACGRRSVHSRRLGARRMTFDRLVGVGTVLPRTSTEQNFVLVETSADGWWYTAPLPAGGLMSMLMTDADVCREQRLTDPEVWLERLRRTDATRDRVGAEPQTMSVQVHPATSVRHRRTDHRPWLAVGDAALAVDPVTGSGLTRALRTAACAATTVVDLLDAPTGGRAEILDRYEDERDAECSEYLRTRLDYYSVVTSMDSPFWLRRQRVARRAAAVASGRRDH